MIRRLFLLLLVGFVSFTVWLSHDAQAQAPSEPQWIWYPEGDPLSSAPSGKRWFRRTFTLPAAAPGAVLEITADNRFVAHVNGVRVGAGEDWAVMNKLSIGKHLVAGSNVLAIEAGNDGGPAGLVVRLREAGKGKAKTLLVSDGAWKAHKEEVNDWTTAKFDDTKWAKAMVLGGYGKVGPWVGGAAAKKSGPRKFTVPEGYNVVEAVKNPGDRGAFSLVNMCFDKAGRLFVSQEGAGVLLCTKPDEKGVLQEVREFCSQVKNCHGMCWVEDVLYLVGNGPKGAGLYRCRDTKKADAIDEVTLLQSFSGGMGEHGPHAVFQGPDKKLYVVLGNHAFAKIGPKNDPNPAKLADNSPLLRWPSGNQGPDQGQKNSTEDVLLPRLNDANGHAANIRAPGGTIWRMDLDGKNPALVAAGFRNQFDAAFSPDAELFSFDSDMEWDEGLPWYRAVRAVHCPPGADFVWRTGAANTPNYYLDSLPPLVETGRGSPVGVTFCDDARFGEAYRGAFFMADWSIGVIYAVHLRRKGATYQGKSERFVVGSPMPVSDVEFGKEGDLWFTVGGRGTAGGVYRVVPPAVQEGKGNKFPEPNVPEKRTVADWVKLSKDPNVDTRIRAIWQLGVHGSASEKDVIVACLKDGDAMVRRRACEALIRLNLLPEVKSIWQLLADEDHYVASAARLVLERINPTQWIESLKSDKNDQTAHHAIIALCHTNKADEHAETIYQRLQTSQPKNDDELLGWLRTIQLSAFHTSKTPSTLSQIAASCDKLFPHANKNVDRELAILLAHFKKTKTLATDVVGKLLDAILKESKSDRPQAIHYFYCLRVIHEGWSKEQKTRLANWFESTRDWNGGNSYRGFLVNIFRDALAAYDLADRKNLLEEGHTLPRVALVIAQKALTERNPELLPALKTLWSKTLSGKNGTDLKNTVEDAVVTIAAEKPSAEHYSDLVKGLSSANKGVVFKAVTGLKKVPTKPKAIEADAKIYRAAIEAAMKLDVGNRWSCVELLRHWSDNRQFGYDKADAQKELAAWQKWYGQAFPKEPALAQIASDKPTPSKYKFEELQGYLTTGEGKNGNAVKGKLAFEKASCLKCHKYGSQGEALGPDLTNLAKRFKRADTLEALFYPSKVISDQYRSTKIVTTKGQQVEGLLAVQGDTYTVLQSDGTKVTLAKKDIEQQFASLLSVMPEKLLDVLSKEEIADLFAYMESEAK